ncbi:hypothetical protein GCM10010168_69920 [Actinoplanes ianthinogenes]|uniref:Uncharacterized protein n=1 Tax=Actinoplanes ianthinogenes TaxID=122358 RepID=A0ABN6CJW7_9ACTN|nr:hypothetical protein [Actinoplanes ianthinogenes]BCJ45191.1 hypothetical protein Aiant_58480 [Actinoplanes ianthinogenes]GGR41180.1 hypothetical protein GCM10010168_69920 [Actinoplanes ianthinogenes]
MTEPEAERDPAQHLMLWTDIRRQPDGSQRRTPIPLDAAAAQFAAMIEAGRAAESLLDPEDADDAVAFSRNRGRVIATLLAELSLRLTPGQSVGAIRSDGAMSELAAEIAGYLRAGY